AAFLADLLGDDVLGHLEARGVDIHEGDVAVAQLREEIDVGDEVLGEDDAAGADERDLGHPTNYDEPMELQGKRIAVLAENMYQEMELWYPVYRFREAGAQVTIVGPGTGKTFASKTGYPVTVDANAGDVSVNDFDAIVVPGGYA